MIEKKISSAERGKGIFRHPVPVMVMGLIALFVVVSMWLYNG